MKALEKDRARRYETANGFATDIQRYLADETGTGVSAQHELPRSEVPAAEQGGGAGGRSGAAGPGRRHHRHDLGPDSRDRRGR